MEAINQVCFCGVKPILAALKKESNLESLCQDSLHLDLPILIMYQLPPYLTIKSNPAAVAVCMEIFKIPLTINFPTVVVSRFFRRTVRKRHAYTCRFSRNCVVDKVMTIGNITAMLSHASKHDRCGQLRCAQRNTCRSCRFDECMRRGMKKEAVQSERDRIRPTSTCTIPDDPLLDALLSAEATVRQLRSSVITRTVDARRQATAGDVTDR
ncbi:unnamed protein product [Strongylus vulgaris]|uniref:Nuclear receptor domain-containing protein n=1 Tax=Strongylus vulgaris TaxID=40348 RepID=A0A3P7JH88_STRVU|nr:unnamed protein product [Strongylus vulgaris]